MLEEIANWAIISLWIWDWYTSLPFRSPKEILLIQPQIQRNCESFQKPDILEVACQINFFGPGYAAKVNHLSEANWVKIYIWHCGFSNNEDLWWMCSRVTLSLIWVLQSCLLSLPCSNESSSLWAYKQNHLDVMPMKCKMNICLKWQFFVIVIVTCPGTGTGLYHHGSWNVFWQEVMEDTGAPCLQNFDFLTSLFIQIWICASSPLSKQILDFCTTSTIPCYGKRKKTNSGRLGGKRGCLMGPIASTATSDGSPDNL